MRIKIGIMLHSSVVIDCKYLLGIRISNTSSSSRASDAMRRGLTTLINSDINRVSRTRPSALLPLRHHVRDPWRLPQLMLRLIMTGSCGDSNNVSARNSSRSINSSSVINSRLSRLSLLRLTVSRDRLST
jgi:hypothetical protein